MPNYVVKFGVIIAAKSKKDLYRKAEKTAQQMTMCVGKKVHPLEYGELIKKETVGVGTDDSE